MAHLNEGRNPTLLHCGSLQAKATRAPYENEGRNPTLLHCGIEAYGLPTGYFAERGSEPDPPSLRPGRRTRRGHLTSERGSEPDPPSLRHQLVGVVNDALRNEGRNPTLLHCGGSGLAGGFVAALNEGRNPTLLHCGSAGLRTAAAASETRVGTRPSFIAAQNQHG